MVWMAAAHQIRQNGSKAVHDPLAADDLTLAMSDNQIHMTHSPQAICLPIARVAWPQTLRRLRQACQHGL